MARRLRDVAVLLGVALLAFVAGQWWHKSVVEEDSWAAPARYEVLATEQFQVAGDRSQSWVFLALAPSAVTGPGLRRDFRTIARERGFHCRRGVIADVDVDCLGARGWVNVQTYDAFLAGDDPADRATVSHFTPVAQQHGRELDQLIVVRALGSD